MDCPRPTNSVRWVLQNGRIRAESRPGEDLVDFDVKISGEWVHVWLALDGDSATLMLPKDY